MSVQRAGEEDDLPRTGRDQSCAFCASVSVEWMHPLDPERVGSRVCGKGHTLPGFWVLCGDCERTYVSGEDEALVRVMKASDAWSGTTPQDEAELIRKPLTAFRAADQGSRRLLSG
jgi:hypothetical protein